VELGVRGHLDLLFATCGSERERERGGVDEVVERDEERVPSSCRSSARIHWRSREFSKAGGA